jgi:hypothetical protein
MLGLAVRFGVLAKGLIAFVKNPEDWGATFDAASSRAYAWK